jgi:WD40 repeat protein
LRLFYRAGRELWQQPVPGTVWAVKISADKRFVVAGYGDGTIRWHRLSNGEEVLALFPHADRQRWIAWPPEGFYATLGRTPRSSSAITSIALRSVKASSSARASCARTFTSPD